MGKHAEPESNTRARFAALSLILWCSRCFIVSPWCFVSICGGPSTSYSSKESPYNIFWYPPNDIKCFTRLLAETLNLKLRDFGDLGVSQMAVTETKIRNQLSIQITPQNIWKLHQNAFWPLVGVFWAIIYFFGNLPLKLKTKKWLRSLNFGQNCFKFWERS